MIKKIALVACLLLAAGCSDDGGGSSGGGTTGATTGGATGATTGATTGTTDGSTTGGTPSGTTAGLWYGNTNFGEAVVVISSSGQLTGLSKAGTRYEAVHGNISGPMNRFLHRDSNNPASATSFTLAGDLPSTQEPPTSDTVSYTLAVTNDGQQLDNSSAAGAFSLTHATTNDVASITPAAVAGTWTAQTSFCASACDIALSVTFGQSGAMTGFTDFNNTGPIALTGTASAVSDSNQYLDVSMTWNGVARTGVVHRDRGTNRLVLNTAGPNDTALQSFTAYLIRQ